MLIENASSLQQLYSTVLYKLANGDIFSEEVVEAQRILDDIRLEDPSELQSGASSAIIRAVSHSLSVTGSSVLFLKEFSTKQIVEMRRTFSTFVSSRKRSDGSFYKRTSLIRRIHSFSGQWSPKEKKGQPSRLPRF